MADENESSTAQLSPGMIAMRNGAAAKRLRKKTPCLAAGSGSDKET